jgi:quinol-cytochrome oxidoreductase complex cytochrome b subunit
MSKFEVRVSIVNWFSGRLPLEFLKKFSREQLAEPQPRHVGWLHTLGFTALFLLVFQIATGVLLLFYYKPSATEAYASVKFIIEKTNYGWFIRQMHAWGANFIVTVLALHLLRVFSYGAYKKPRELTWMAGALLFLITLGFGFTGYLLPWDQLAFWGTTVGSDSTKEVPLIGGLLLKFLRGGELVSEITLSRFFALHVAILPLALFALLGLHLFLIRYHHISPLTRIDEPEPLPEQILASGGRPYFPDHFKKELLISYTVLIGLVVTAISVHMPLGKPANPMVTPPHIKPDWYFLPVYQLLKYVPGWLGVLGVGAFAGALVLLPLLDRSPERHPRRRKVMTTIGVIAIVATVGLGWLGHISDSTWRIFGTRVYFDLKAIPQVLKEGEKPGSR